MMEYLKPMERYFYVDSFYPNQNAIIRLGVDICTAVEELGKRSIVHRDIKPSNIFVDIEGRFKLGDFGIARYVKNTTELTMIGTPMYTAPEVFYGNRVGIGNNVDMYSLGLVLYELLNLRDLPRDRINIQPPRDGSPALKNIVLKACAFNPDDRFTDITQMKSALLTV